MPNRWTSDVLSRSSSSWDWVFVAFLHVYLERDLQEHFEKGGIVAHPQSCHYSNCCSAHLDWRYSEGFWYFDTWSSLLFFEHWVDPYSCDASAILGAQRWSWSGFLDQPLAIGSELIFSSWSVEVVLIGLFFLIIRLRVIGHIPLSNSKLSYKRRGFPLCLGVPSQCPGSNAVALANGILAAMTMTNFEMEPTPAPQPEVKAHFVIWKF